MIKKQRKNSSSTEEHIIAERNRLAKNEKVAAIWTRVSSADQYHNNHSIETQENACIEYCQRNGIRVKKCFGGENESGSKAGEKFLDMIGEVLADPEYNHIIVYDFDRFSRSSNDGIIYKTKAKKSGVMVKSVNQQIDETNILAEQIENILIIIANIDNAMRRHKCHAGMVACIERGELYSRPPFGYTSRKVGKSHVIKVNEQGKILKKAFEWIANEPEITQTEIIRRLKIRGVEMTKQKLSTCLRNCFYCGLLEHKYLNGKIIDGCQEPLISKGLFKRVQDVLDGNHTNYQHAKETPKFPLKNHLKCSKDKHILSGYTVKAKNKDYYKCSLKGCKTNISATTVHNQYADILKSISIPDEYIPLLEMVIKHKLKEKEGEVIDRTAQISQNLKTLQTKLKRVTKKYVTEDLLSEEDYLDIKKELEKEIANCGSADVSGWRQAADQQ